MEVYVVTEEQHEDSIIQGIYTSLELVKKEYPSPEYNLEEFGEKGYAWLKFSQDCSLCVTVYKLDTKVT